MSGMKFENKLPSGYSAEEIEPDKKSELRLYAVSAAAAALLTAAGCFICDISLLFDAAGVFALILRLAVITVLTAVCLVGQEYIKCILIGRLTGKPARVVRDKFGAHIEYRCWLDAKTGTVVCLVPTAAVCAVLLIAMLILPDTLFWQCYVIFTVNIAACVPEAYTVHKLRSAPCPALMKNEGGKTLIATEKNKCT